MSTLGTYSFLPWLRQGLANQIATLDFDSSVKVRASMQVQLEACGEKLAGGTDAKPIDRPAQLFGPGGRDPRHPDLRESRMKTMSLLHFDFVENGNDLAAPRPTARQQTCHPEPAQTARDLPQTACGSERRKASQPPCARSFGALRQPQDDHFESASRDSCRTQKAA